MLSAAARDRSLAAVQIAWADAASCAPPRFFFFFLILYRRFGLHTGHIKPAEQSRLTNVRRGACEVVSLLSLTHHPALPRPPISVPKANTVAAFSLGKKEKKEKNAV